MKQNDQSDGPEHDLQAELLRVRAQAAEIDQTHQLDDSAQRVVLTLPKSLVHMAQFIAVMENEPMPGSLDFWQYISEFAVDDPIPARNAKKIMRAWMEEEITTRVHVAMLQLQTEAKEQEKTKIRRS